MIKQLAALWRRQSVTAEEQALSVREVVDILRQMGSSSWLHDDDLKISYQEALTCSAVYACVTEIATSLGVLPIRVVDRRDDSPVKDHPVNRVLRQPNPASSGPEAREAMLMGLALYGNCYAWATFGRDAYPETLYPLRPSHVAPRLVDGEIRYAVQIGEAGRTFSAADIVHAKMPSLDGLCGISPLIAGGPEARVSNELRTFAAKFFSNGAALGGVIELPPMTSEALGKFKEQWLKEYVGNENAHKFAAAPGLKVHRNNATPAESQANEARLFQLRLLCGIYKVPPHRVGDLQKASYASMEEQDASFAKHTLLGYAVRHEAALERVLLRSDEQDHLAIKYNLDAAVRAKLSERAAADSSLVQAGIITTNEARGHHGLRPVAGGDTLRVPLNTSPVGDDDDVATDRDEDKKDPKTPGKTNKKPAAGESNGPENEGRSHHRVALLNLADQVIRKEQNALARIIKKHSDPEERAEAEATFWSGHIETLRRSFGGVCDVQSVAEQWISYRTVGGGEHADILVAMVETETPKKDSATT